MKSPGVSKRIENLPAYIFDKINTEKDAARAAGRDIIDFGMGNPDLPTPEHIVETLLSASRKPETHRYSASRGIPALRAAVAEWYETRFGVTLDREKEVTAVIGSKEGLCHFALAAFNPGESLLVPDPTYPAHVFPFNINGVNTISMPLLPENRFLPDLEAAEKNIRPDTMALLLSFPHNPTTATATLDYLGAAVDFCRKKDLFLIHDLAYGELVFGPEQAPSILQVPGARELAVEFFSLSKTYSMAGWRVGFAVGNSRLVGSLVKLKSYFDYGIFQAIQEAAITALSGPQDCVSRYRSIYRRRRDLLVEGLAAAGWKVPSSPATMYLWSPLPEPFREKGSLEFASWLMEKADVAVSPGVAFGAHGEGFVRIALVENEERIGQAVDKIEKALRAFR